jgi:hypothetical protein
MGGRAKRENIPAKVKVAVAFMIEQRADLAAAALHAGISLYELRRSMGKPQVRRYALEQRGVQRQPGLTIVVYQPATSEQRIAHAPSPTLLDVTPAPAAEPMPSEE